MRCATRQMGGGGAARRLACLSRRYTYCPRHSPLPLLLKDLLRPLGRLASSIPSPFILDTQDSTVACCISPMYIYIQKRISLAYAKDCTFYFLHVDTHTLVGWACWTRKN
ncbi:uncharacterized protein SCHCODRAFT_02063693 [Schizophyllum commune H4-8]|uniref:uncharacterized protein n=1 Tax=Schizophyllum commune (strain H4-8 / FGSC 9210) TaxID=578458 RepID=UPI00215E0D05|nr:uncharacterized protein SCHCODRAFT_02063693 [Schizophyllum commune H4-8]KAI5888822.1 hypothetical protein SCHCODRAFT_02063693 [Schizophyllum commune H4-8]